MPAHQVVLSAIAACALVFAQMQNFGNAPDPEEKKRGEKMISQSETQIALSEKNLSESRKQNRVTNYIAVLALVVSLIALLVSLWSTFHHN